MGSEPLVYPNPLRGEGPLQVAFRLEDRFEEVRVTVVTVAYRKVFEQTFDLTGRKGNVALRLDLQGRRLANGLYYVVVSPSSGAKSTCKLMILR